MWLGVEPSPPEWWVCFSVEVTATFLDPQNLRDFPFDRQRVVMQLESRAHDVNKMVWQLVPDADEDMTPLLGQPDGFNISGAVATVDVAYYPKIGLASSRANLGLVLDRDPSFFVTSFVQPLSLTMCITILTIALMPVGQVGPRNAAATGGISTTVSWVFVVSNMVPVLPYPTRLHSYLRFCFFVFAAIFVYNSWAFIMLDRFKTQIESARKSFKGRLAFCCACCARCICCCWSGGGGGSGGEAKTAPGGDAAKDNKVGKKKEDEIAVIDMDKPTTGGKGEDAPAEPRSRGGAGDAAEATRQLLQFFLDKDAKEKEKEDKDKAKKEFKVPTACLPGVLADFSVRIDFVFMVVFLIVYTAGTALILRGPLPDVVLP